MRLEVGQLAPDFELLSDEGSPIKLSDYRGGRVLLFFYPNADTPGCTIQACGFRDNFATIQSADTTVFGISPNTVEELRKWRAKEKFQYNLLADHDHAVADQFGVWGEKTSFGKTYEGVIRSHFLVGADGRIEDIQYGVSPQKSIEEALRQITA
jgi:thioredoxin-dependent peroxiredoxin